MRKLVVFFLCFGVINCTILATTASSAAGQEASTFLKPILNTRYLLYLWKDYFRIPHTYREEGQVYGMAPSLFLGDPMIKGLKLSNSEIYFVAIKYKIDFKLTQIVIRSISNGKSNSLAYILTPIDDAATRQFNEQYEENAKALFRTICPQGPITNVILYPSGATPEENTLTLTPSTSQSGSLEFFDPIMISFYSGKKNFSDDSPDWNEPCLTAPFLAEDVSKEAH